jgi:hypothetical protein
MLASMDTPSEDRSSLQPSFTDPDTEWTDSQYPGTPPYVSDSQKTTPIAPTVAEIIQLTRQLLTTVSKTDPIRECGRAALSLLPSDPGMCQELAYQKLHDVPYREVKTCWRRLYTDAMLWKVVELVDCREGIQDIEEMRTQGRMEDWLDEMVKMLDMALILTGAPEREEVIELWFSALKAVVPSGSTEIKDCDNTDRPTKRRRVSPSDAIIALPQSFPAILLIPAPTLEYPIPRAKEPSMSNFQSKISDISQYTPLIIEGALGHWPALDERPWSDPSYLLEQTLGGRRLVPIEVGKSYTDDGWGQKIITFKQFMETYMLEKKSESSVEDVPQKGYLAQHDLFAQVPSLRADISIPDYCYCSPAPSPHLTHIKATAKLEEPLLNAWFGPAGTVSPLHTDPYHNILAQAVGYKYVRLYAPKETPHLYPRCVDENGVDMSNTSQVDLDEAQRANGDQDFYERFPTFHKAPYMEGILAPGECLYIPVGWWHYIRSLTPSFSVSFWFN